MSKFDLKSIRHLKGKWKWPTVTYTNIKRRDAGTVFAMLRRPWFRVTRYWSGRIVLVQIAHHEWNIDFRASWIADMAPNEPAASKQT